MAYALVLHPSLHMILRWVTAIEIEPLVVTTFFLAIQRWQTLQPCKIKKHVILSTVCLCNLSECILIKITLYVTWDQGPLIHCGGPGVVVTAPITSPCRQTPMSHGWKGGGANSRQFASARTWPFGNWQLTVLCCIPTPHVTLHF